MKRNDKVVIGHAPSDHGKKGTTYLISAFDVLSATYPHLELEIIENREHKEALAEYRDFDILVDKIMPSDTGQMGRGWYGVVTNEAQHMGLPVVTTIREDLRRYLPKKSGIVSTDKDELVDTLSRLIEDPELREELGNQGRNYVRTYHDPLRMARITTDLYRS